MSDPWDDLAVERLRLYVHRNDETPEWAATAAPLTRAVLVYADTWRPWLDGHRALRTDWSDVAVSALDALPLADSTAQGATDVASTAKR